MISFRVALITLWVIALCLVAYRSIMDDTAVVEPGTCVDMMSDEPHFATECGDLYWFFDNPGDPSAFDS